MFYHSCFWIVAFLGAIFGQKITDESIAAQYLAEYSEQASRISNGGSLLYWAHDTNITAHNQEKALNYTKQYKPYYEEVAANASKFDYENFSNASLKRVFKQLADTGYAALPDEKYDEIMKKTSGMETIYSEAKICKPNSEKKYSLEPELTEILATSRDYNELLWAWKNWRDKTGRKMRNDYLRFVQLSNEASKLNGYKDTGEDWRSGYAVDGEPDYNFRTALERIYNELAPFYKKLHAYVKIKLKEQYGEDKFPNTGHIPAHLLGNMWAQTWGNIESLTLPYPDSKPVNATPAIQRMTVREMFNKSDEFFTSLGLYPVTKEFWERSMLEKPEDGRDVVCHASAWDFNDGRDFRIKQCTRKNMEDFITVHHEMGHVQYYLQYKDLLYSFRSGANPGFHEAVGDVLALSVSTPKHLKAVGLIESYPDDDKADINYLMSIALDKIVFLPFGKLMDDYRWSLFASEITENQLNAQWWARRCKYQGISSPVERTEEDFDAGAKYHIPANVPYVRYLVSYILQFQFHKALCNASNHTGPLHKCDIYQSQEAGKLLGDMLKLGSSKGWKDALEAIIGSREMSATPLVEYFQPLIDWLDNYLINVPPADIGWTDECPTNLPKGDTVTSGECDFVPTTTPNSSASIMTSYLVFISLFGFIAVF